MRVLIVEDEVKMAALLQPSLTAPPGAQPGQGIQAAPRRGQ
jgi:hypothetical protein